MLSNIGIPGLIIILVLALIIFGPSKLPEIGRAFGRSLREFKDASKDIISDTTAELKDASSSNATEPKDSVQSSTASKK